MHIKQSAWVVALASLLWSIGDRQIPATTLSGSISWETHRDVENRTRSALLPPQTWLAKTLERLLPGRGAVAAVLPNEFAPDMSVDREPTPLLDWIKPLETWVAPVLSRSAPPPPSGTPLPRASIQNMPVTELSDRPDPIVVSPTPTLPLSLLFLQTLQGSVSLAQERLPQWNTLVPPVVIVPTGEAERLTSQPLVAMRQAISQPNQRCLSALAPEQSSIHLANVEDPTHRRDLGSNPTDRYSIWVKGCRIAELPDLATADQMAQAITALLHLPNLQSSQLKPALDQEEPVIKLADRVIFRVSPELAQQLQSNAELLAIAWLNNLRSALGQAPLDLATAQAQMYGLEETPTVLEGMASWYGPHFQGRITATGEVYNQYDLTAAHRDLPFGTFLKVINLHNGKSVIVRVNDRGPYVDEDLRILDLSYRAATYLDSDEAGLADIEAVVLKPKGSPNPSVFSTIANAAIGHASSDRMQAP